MILIYLFDPFMLSTGGLDHAIVFSAVDKKILMRHYKIKLKKSASRVPLVDVSCFVSVVGVWHKSLFRFSFLFLLNEFAIFFPP